MREIDRLWGSDPGTADGERLDVLVTLADLYESMRWPIADPDPIDAIKFRMEQQGLSATDLIPLISGADRVAQVLERRRPLTLAMIRRLHEKLGIPADVLIRRVA